MMAHPPISSYDMKLQCYVREISYCSETGTGMLVTYADTCPDMSACIQMFEELMPTVAEIWVSHWISGVTVMNTVYRRLDGKWRVFVPKFRSGKRR
ncbi:hypothetical protein [Ovoidimarina sediminis]|uniref:hypothetical protein n=1 Tax=Ovoidimarina sediminis TaxID=3079856 RepID=UPI00292D6F3B|nr:hypothetical protein [Rhodophyticola sp. MJ-SS7]